MSITAIQVAQNESFQMIAIIDAIKLLATKCTMTEGVLMTEFVSGKNDALNLRVAEMVAAGARVVAAELFQ